MNNRNIIIFGGNGFIGSNLANYLSTKNYKVYSFDINPPAVYLDGVNYIKGDFYNINEISEALIDMDIIIHAVSSINPSNSNIDFVNAYKKDIDISIELFNLAYKNKQKLVFISSGGTVYGIQNNFPISEDASTSPINHYGSLKLSIENILKVFNFQHNTNFKIARISNPYGPGQDSRKGVGFIHSVLSKCIFDEEIEVWGDGSIVRDYIYIDDVCRSLLNIICYEGNHDVFNVSSAIGTSQSDILQLSEKLGYKPKVVYKDFRTIDLKTSILSNSRLLEINNFQLTSLEKGINVYNDYLIKTLKNK